MFSDHLLCQWSFTYVMVFLIACGSKNCKAVIASVSQISSVKSRERLVFLKWEKKCWNDSSKLELRIIGIIPTKVHFVFYNCSSHCVRVCVRAHACVRACLWFWFVWLVIFFKSSSDARSYCFWKGSCLSESSVLS